MPPCFLLTGGAYVADIQRPNSIYSHRASLAKGQEETPGGGTHGKEGESWQYRKTKQKESSR